MRNWGVAIFAYLVMILLIPTIAAATPYPTALIIAYPLSSLASFCSASGHFKLKKALTGSLAHANPDRKCATAHAFAHTYRVPQAARLHNIREPAFHMQNAAYTSIVQLH